MARGRVKVSLLVAIALIGGFSLLTFYPSLVKSASVEELRRQRESLSREILRNRKKAKQKEKEAKVITGQISQIDGDINATKNKIALTKKQIEETQADIDKVTEEISQKESELAKRKADQDETIRVLYETADIDPLLLLASSYPVSEVIDRAYYLEALQVQIESIIDTVSAMRDELVKQKEDLNSKQASLNDLKRQHEAYKKGLEFSKSRKRQLLVTVRLKQSEYEQLLERARSAYQDVNSELYRLEQAARRRARRGSSKKVGKITFGWAFDGVITTNFGDKTPVQNFHTGIDIDGVIGDPILASADGEVTYVGGTKSYGYGYHVIIDHGNGVSTLYGHMSGYDVDVGDQVKRGQTIGFIGNTGFAFGFNGGDGSHLHFEIREDNVPVNPILYLP